MTLNTAPAPPKGGCDGSPSESQVAQTGTVEKTPISQANYLAVQSNITNENLAKVKVNIAGPYTALLSGATMGLARMLATRKAASFYRKATGRLRT